jgi:hypothetical protein
MYVFSPLGGLLCDRLGARGTIRLGAGTLLAAGLCGALARPASVAALTTALWNAWFWSGSRRRGSTGNGGEQSQHREAAQGQDQSRAQAPGGAGEPDEQVRVAWARARSTTVECMIRCRFIPF